MTAVMAIPQLAPRPSPVAIAAWSRPGLAQPLFMDGKENRPALKQLQQTTPAVRSRKERPCDGCRRRKSKCVLQDSRRCVLCDFHKQECTFVEKAQPRKRKLDDDSTTDGSVKRSPPATKAKPEQPPRLSTQLPSAQLSTPVPLPVSPRRPFAVDESLSLQRHRHCKLLGQTTALDSALIALGTFNDRNETASVVGTLRQVTTHEYFNTYDDAEVHIPDDEARALVDIEQTVGSHGSALIDIYFRNVHPSYPIIQKQAFLDQHRHGDRQFNPPLLAAMYLLALQWWNSTPSLSVEPKPDVGRLEYLAISSLTVAMQRPKISAVQAGLLLLQRAKSSTWTLTVQLVALAQDIGLHLDCTDWSIPPWERRLRKRLAWALYMQDKWSAVMHGRPSHISAADWAVSPLLNDDFDEEVPTSDHSADTDPLDAQTTRGRSIFMQMITLTSIMGEVCETFYSQTARAEYARAGRYATQLVLNRAKPVQIKLKDWFARLPAECKMESPSSTDPNPATGYLHLAYFATEISIHRRIVQSLSDPAAVPDPYLLSICRSAAKTRLISAMDFVNRLQPAHLGAFWYFASASNFALIGTFGALLQASSPAREEAVFYETRLREFRWTLGVSAQRAEWIGEAVEWLRACEEMLTGLAEKPVASAEVQRAPKLETMSLASMDFEGGGEEEGEEEMEDDEEDEDGIDVEGAW